MGLLPAGGAGGYARGAPCRRPPPNLKELIPRIAPRPVFLIYAERGQGGEKLSADYYEAAGRPKQLWKTDSGHVGGYDAAPRLYERRVTSFFDRALLD